MKEEKNGTVEGEDRTKLWAVGGMEEGIELKWLERKKKEWKKEKRMKERDEERIWVRKKKEREN